MQDGADRAFEDALQYEAPVKLRGLYRSLTLYLHICTFQSEADGFRTHALRRAKPARHFARTF